VGDRVLLLGRRADVSRLLAASRLFLFPSRSEGLPGSVIEAMLAGRAIVASDIDVHREMIEDGRTGFLVRPGDHETLARVTLRLLGDPSLCEEVGRAARQEAEERFEIARIVEQYEAYYDRMLEGSVPGA
jgi:glycosyltransferase involved in cell wall biosynthesis